MNSASWNPLNEQTEDLSLPTQLRACAEYCRRRGYEVARFHEEGESANTMDRSQFQKLLTFCCLNKGRVHFVVVFNLTRFARDKYDQFALRSHLQSLGATVVEQTRPPGPRPSETSVLLEPRPWLYSVQYPADSPLEFNEARQRVAPIARQRGRQLVIEPLNQFVERITPHRTLVSRRAWVHRAP
jgi:hypothetical protein